jgi:hypothetical protein
VQRQDLEASLKELADLRDELAETVERRFSETFAAVAEHFEEVAATLFPGGDGRLRLVEPEDAAEHTAQRVVMQEVVVPQRRCRVQTHKRHQRVSGEFVGFLEEVLGGLP